MEFKISPFKVLIINSLEVVLLTTFISANKIVEKIIEIYIALINIINDLIDTIPAQFKHIFSSIPIDFEKLYIPSEYLLLQFNF